MATSLLTIDDFDPLFIYPDPTIWTTPNPQDNPTWWNESSAVTGSPWHQATYHYTTTVGAAVSLNFTGSSFTLLGAGGPSSTNYSITLDPQSSQPFTQTYQIQNATTGRTVLFTTDGLTDEKHNIEIVNYGDGLLIDLAVVEVKLGAEGASLSNTTVQNDDSRIQYSGDWTTQSGPNFSGGTSTYTSGPNKSLKFSFEGSALYIYGDQVNDHGFYTIYLNGTSPEALYGRYTGRSGCGGGYEKYCEKLHGLVGFIGGLPSGTHEVVLVNDSPAEGNITFFDFDYIEYTTPSQYLSSGSFTSLAQFCPFTNCSSTSTSPSSAVSGSSGSSTARSSSPSGSSASVSVSASAAATSSGTGYVNREVNGGLAGSALMVLCLFKLFGF